MQSLVFFMGMVVNVKIKIVKFEQVIDEDGSLFLFWTVEQTLRVDLSSFASCTCTTRQTINPSRVVNYCIYANAIKFFFCKFCTNENFPLYITCMQSALVYI